MYVILLKLCPFFLFTAAHVCNRCNQQEPKTKYVVVSNESLTFHNAFLRCKQWGLDPAEIITREDQAELAAELELKAEKNYYWVFATDFETKPTYNWLNSGRSLSFSNFKNKETSSSLCAGVQVYKGAGWKWYTYSCNDTVAFICQVRPSQNDELVQKQLQLKDEQCLNKSNQLIHEANTKNLEKIKELNAALEATKRRIEELEKKVDSHSDELVLKQLQLKYEQCLNKSNRIHEANSKHLEKINELNAALEETKREKEELKEELDRQCPTGGDIDIQIR